MGSGGRGRASSVEGGEALLGVAVVGWGVHGFALPQSTSKGCRHGLVQVNVRLGEFRAIADCLCK